MNFTCCDFDYFESGITTLNSTHSELHTRSEQARAGQSSGTTPLGRPARGQFCSENIENHAFFLHFSLRFLRKAALGAHIYLDAAAWVCDTEVATSREWSICTTDTSFRADAPVYLCESHYLRFHCTLCLFPFLTCLCAVTLSQRP